MALPVRTARPLLPSAPACLTTRGLQQQQQLIWLCVFLLGLSAACQDELFNVLTLATSAACSNPRDVAFRAQDGAVFAACNNGGGVVQIIESTITTVATDQDCPSAIGLAIRPSDGAVFAACQDAGQAPGTGTAAVIQILNSTITGIVDSTQCSFASGNRCLAVSEGWWANARARAAGVVFRASDGALLASCYNGGVVQAVNSTVTVLATADQCPAAYGARALPPGVEAAPGQLCLSAVARHTRAQLSPGKQATIA
jgi:hypothetical protein